MAAMLLTALLAGATDEPIERLFTEFFGRFVQPGDERYASAAGRLARRAAFADNVQTVRELNLHDPHATYSVMVPWADLTAPELARWHGGGGVASQQPRMVCQFSQDPPYAPPAALSPTATPKPSLDYVALGATVPVKDQGNCSSCWAHSAIAAVEGRLKLDTGNTTSLSEQYIMDCDKNRGGLKGCGGGLPERVLQWLTKAGKKTVGVASAGQYPYVSRSGVDPTKKQCDHAAPLVAQVEGFGTVAGDAQSMLAAATQYGVLSVCMDSHPLTFYKSGIITSPQCSAVTSNHCVAIVGYGTENGQDYWKVRNSYGTQFGEQGYFRIERLSGSPAAPCGMSGCVLAVTGATFTGNSSSVTEH